LAGPRGITSVTVRPPLALVRELTAIDGATSNLSWNYKPPKISELAAGYTDIVFSAKEGDLHWILKPGLHGAYQYFVNRALPVLGEFRTLWRLDNRTFTYGWTNERDEKLVPLSDIRNAASEKVQDETWERADGSFITKYDLATFMPVVEGEPCVWGLHGTMKRGEQTEGIGSFYIHGGKVSLLACI
jgi:rhamnogalacturonan endolyase